MPTARLDEQFPFNTTDGIIKTLRDLTRVLEARFGATEAELADRRDVVAELTDLGLARINEVLLPSVLRIQQLASLGFLMATSGSSVALALGAKTFIVDPGDQRALFTPSPYVAVERAGDPNTRAVAQKLSYDPLGGVLSLVILACFGDTGPHDDWIISASPGVTEISRIAWEGAQASQTSAAASAASAIASKDLAVGAKDLAVPAANTATTQAGIATTKAAEAAASALALSAITSGADPALDTFAEVLSRFLADETNISSVLTGLANRLRTDAVMSLSAADLGKVYASLKLDTIPPQGRLTLATGVPVLTSAVTSGTIYYTSDRGRLVPVWDPSLGVFVPRQLGELSNVLANSSTGNAGPAAAATNGVYDLLVADISGTAYLIRSPAWSTATTRGTGSGTAQLQRVAGLLVNAQSIAIGGNTIAAGAATYLGTIRVGSASVVVVFDPNTSASGGGACTVGLWNAYNRSPVATTSYDSNITHTYSSASFRPWQNGTGMACYFVRGLDVEPIDVSFIARGQPSSGGFFQTAVSIGSGAVGPTAIGQGSNNMTVPAAYAGLPGLGAQYAIGLQASDGNSTTFYGGQSSALIAKLTY